MEEARTGKTLTGQPSKRTKRGKKQLHDIEAAKDPSVKKGQEMMALHFGRKASDPPHAPKKPE